MRVKFSPGRHSLQLTLWVDGEAMLARELIDQPLSIGDDERCTIQVDGLAPLTLLHPLGGGFGLHLSPTLQGKLRSGGHTLRVVDGLLCDPRPEPLLFRDGDRGALWLTPRLQLRFTVHEQQRAFVAPLLPRDPRLAAALALSTVVLLGGALAITSRPLPPEKRLARKTLRRLRTRPAIIARTLLQRRKPKLERRTGLRRDASRSGERRRRSLARRGRRTTHGRALVRRSLRPATRVVDRLLAQLEQQGAPAGVARGMPGRRRARRSVDPLAALDQIMPTSALAPTPTPLGPRMRLRLPSSRATARTLPRSPKGSSALTRSAIRRVVAAHSGAIRLCYEQELLRSRRPVQGSLLVRWRIDHRGRAQDVRTLRDGLGRPPLRRCILHEIQRWHFPRCESGEACGVIFPFELFARS